MSEQTIGGTTGAAVTYNRTVQEKAKSAISGCWIVGIALLVTGAGFAAVSLPGTGSGLYADTDTGSTGGFLFGLALLGVGQIVVFVGIIATAVRLGVTAARGQG